jgi:dTDP-4-dehydrorhamnose 3,5-epimerase
MLFEKTNFSGLYEIKPKFYADDRGGFMEAFSKRVFDEAGQVYNFVQDNQSTSKNAVIRGLHFQNAPHAQTKLVRVLTGRILDVALDLRKREPTFGMVYTSELSSENKHQLLIPKGFAHGFVVLSDQADILYKCDDYYYPETEGGVNIFDRALGLGDLKPQASYIQSEKDRYLPSFSDAIFKF